MPAENSGTATAASALFVASAFAVLAAVGWSWTVASAQDDPPFSSGEVHSRNERPAGNQTYEVPLSGPMTESLMVEKRNGLISLVVRDASLKDVLSALADTQGLNIVTAESVDARLTVTLDRVTLEDALDAILAIAGYTWTRNKNILHVTSISDSSKLSPETQGRRTAVFELDYASAEDVNSSVSGMLSPAGQAFAIKSSEADNRRTREVLVVEDLPRYVERIGQYVERIDQPPRQVLIEAHVLQIELDDQHRHGINFEHIFDLSNNAVRLKTTGLANNIASQAFFVEISGGNLSTLLECLKTTTDAKTLASPRLLVLSGQTAKIQVGEQLGFRVTTTTETSTMEDVRFLDVGVVLEVTPRVSRDQRVLMRVKPEVSSGQINPSTGLPEEETTELQTDVMLNSGEAIVIGGLIQETDNDLQSKIPWLGDLKYVGKLFQRKERAKNRVETIIALLPRVVPYDPLYQEQTAVDALRAQTPLLHGSLERYPRPWEPNLLDAVDNPVVIRLPPVRFCGIGRERGKPCNRCRREPCPCPNPESVLVAPPLDGEAEYIPSEEPLPVHTSAVSPRSDQIRRTSATVTYPIKRLPPTDSPDAGLRPVDAVATPVLRLR